jgi:hypothetical protein
MGDYPDEPDERASRVHGAREIPPAPINWNLLDANGKLDDEAEIGHAFVHTHEAIGVLRPVVPGALQRLLQGLLVVRLHRAGTDCWEAGRGSRARNE